MCVVCVCVCVNCSLDHRVLLRCEYICVMYCILEEKGFSSKQVCVCVCERERERERLYSVLEEKDFSLKTDCTL